MLIRKNLGLTTYTGPAGDRNWAAMVASPWLGVQLASQLGVTAVVVGQPVEPPAVPVGWEAALHQARPSLEQMSSRLDSVMGHGLTPVSVITRCAVAMATLPVVLAHRPDAVVMGSRPRCRPHVLPCASPAQLGA